MSGMRLAALLTGVTFADEVAAGIPMLGAPDLRSGLGLSYQAVALLLFVLPLAVALLLEPPLLLRADRQGRKPFVVGGLIGMAAAQVAVGLAPSLPTVVLALPLIATASGCACGAAQATLVEADPARSEWWMTRWALSATLGDLAAPLLLAAVAFCGGAWRQAFVVSGALTALYAAAVARRPFPAPLAAPSSEAQPPAPSTWRVVAAAAGNRRLLAWLSGVFLCSFLDELLLALGALHLAENLGLGAAARAGVLAAFPIGAVGGLAVCERLLARAAPRSVLAGSAACCTAAYLGWLAAPSAIWSGVLLALVGASAAPLYPIAKAQAYRALPGRPGAVNALGQLFTPAEVALPFLLGVLADRCGLLAALLVLVLQPVGILALALLSSRSSAPAETSR